ncbi:M20 family metallopeptidase [Gordonia sp. ABSL11-1]|uniref:M20 family metallopeptidase n=1 Tax=Gordonia sp. ABSL11-1 TaxID=3053924 RepID=UPI0025735681|nr:M20 family metallopeptidase [Gordonia sp. ABSL11-1]MDL9948954.1 M20 family metallopeptidase [Gordonia sp. ABSL11-1]
MNDLDKRIGQSFEDVSGEAINLSHWINAHPELAFEEHESAAKIIEVLAGHGFVIRRRVAELDTAFTATIGSGDLLIGICVEMDALPEIGHGCGHNVIAAAGVGAALALAPYVDELDLTLRVFGTPAEESGTGKEIMVRAGVFDEVHAAIMIHPSLKDVVRPRFRAARSWRLTYTGVGGHASRPWSARNAADATVLAQAAIGLLRQQLRDGIRVHHVVKEAGGAVNVIADRTVVECMIRCDTIAEVDEIWTRVRACFEAGAHATGTELDIETLPSLYREFRNDDDLATIFQRRAEQTGRSFPDYEDALFGSTDMGNVSQVVPALHPMLSFDLPADQGNHTAAFAAAAGGVQGDRFVAEGGLAMALTIADVARSSELRARLHRAASDRSIPK